MVSNAKTGFVIVLAAVLVCAAICAVGVPSLWLGNSSFKVGRLFLGLNQMNSPMRIGLRCARDADPEGEFLHAYWIYNTSPH